MTIGLEALAGRWLQRQQHLLLPWLAVFMAAGIGWYFALTAEPAVWAGPVAIAVCAAGLLALRRARYRSALAAVAFGLVLGLAMSSAGFSLAQWRTNAVASPILGQAIDAVQVTGTIRSVDFLEAGKGLRLILGDLEIEDLPKARTPRFVRIKVRQGQDLRAGQRVTMRAGLNPPSGPVAPHAFDFQFYAWFRQIGAFGFSYDDPVVVDARIAPGNYAEKARQAIGARVGRSLSGPEAAMSVAMMNGEVSGVSADDWDAMRDSGLAHILAISGSHVTVLAGFVFFAVRGVLALFPRMALYWPIKKIAAGVALVAAAFYVYMVGPLIPIVRAWLMTDLIFVAVLFDRMPVSMNLLAFSAMVVMAFLPEQVLGPSFQMSYAAVAALILFYEASREWWRRVFREAGWLRRAGLYALGILGTSFAAELATTPLSLFHFQQLTIYGLAANMLAAPVLSFIVMPAVVLVFMALPFGLEDWPVRMLGFGDGLILRIARMVAGWPHAALHFAAWPGLAVLLMAAAALCACGLRGRVRGLAVPLLAMSIVAIALHRPPDILVTPSGRLMAVRDRDAGLAISSVMAERFTADNWMQLTGYQDSQPARWPHEGRSGDLACDEEGCRLERAGHKVAFSLKEQAQASDCQWADMVVSAVPLTVQSCKAGHVVDVKRMGDQGVVALWLDGHRESVGEVRGHRPWVISNGR